MKFGTPRIGGGFTLVEILVAIAVISILVALSASGYSRAQMAGRKAASSNNLRQFGAAAGLYLSDHGNAFFPYRQDLPDGSVTWWFGAETAKSMRSPEGKRQIDATRSPLAPYLTPEGGVEICPGLTADSLALKPKYSGSSYGYGYNVLLGGGWMGAGPLLRATDLSSPGNTITFATCAQVNTFEAPASSSHPMIEAFYGLDDRNKTIHFRFFGSALVLFLDGHIAEMPICPGTEDDRLPGSVIGRLTPVGSFDMLR